MPTTPEDLSIPRPSLGATANIEEAVNPALERISAIMAPQDQGPWSTIPTATPARKGARYYATDRKLEYLCTGSEWRQVGTWVRRVYTEYMPTLTGPGIGGTPRKYAELVVPFPGLYRVETSWMLRNAAGSMDQARVNVWLGGGALAGPLVGDVFARYLIGSRPQLESEEDEVLHGAMTVALNAGTLDLFVSLVASYQWWFGSRARVSISPVQEF